MRTTLTIDDDVLVDARQLAAAEHRSLGSVISSLARQSLAPIQIALRDGLPVFDVAVGTPTITCDDIARALNDE